jgi:predicted NodU family carbamoyl transferase
MGFRRKIPLVKKTEVCLGLSFGHGDSSAALVIDGTLVAAVEEERFSRIKHDASFPKLAIGYCLRHAGLSGADVTAVAIAKDPTKHWWKKLRLFAAHPKLAEKKTHPDFLFGKRTPNARHHPRAAFSDGTPLSAPA